MTSTFFSLPDSISTLVLSDWITTRTLFVFSSAVCNNRMREKFSRLVTYKSFVSHGLTPQDRYKFVNYFGGLKTRALKIKNLKIQSYVMNDCETAENTMSTMITALGDHDCGLQHLDLSRCYLNKKSLLYLSKMFYSLTSINLNNCRSDFSFIGTMGEYFPQLQSFHVSACYELNVDGIILLLNGCRNIHSLDFSHCGRVNEVCIDWIVGLIGPQLQSLNIDGCTIDFFVYNTCIQQLVKCPQLKYLRTSHFEAFISMPYYLEHSYNAHIVVDSVEDSQYLRKHYVLHVFSCLADSLNCFPHVNELVIANRNCTFPKLKSLLLQLMDRLKKLHTLDIASFGISVTELHEVIDVYQNLRHLRVSFCRNLTYTSAIDLMRKYTPSRIVSLKTPDLEYNITDGKLVLKFKQLTSGMFSSLLLPFTVLHTLELYNSELLTDEVLTTVKEKCAATLHSLSLIYCRQLGLEKILELLQACVCLKSITLFGNKDFVSELALLKILRTVPQLEWFQCAEMSTLSAETQQEVLTICPLIRIYNE